MNNDQSTGHQSQAEINRPKGDAGQERGWDSLNTWAGPTWRSARKTDQESAVAALGASSNKPIIRTKKAHYALAVGSTVCFCWLTIPTAPGWAPRLMRQRGTARTRGGLLSGSVMTCVLAEPKELAAR